MQSPPRRRAPDALWTRSPRAALPQVGYSGSNYNGITYDLAFESAIDVSCGDENLATGNTSTQAPVQVSVTG